MNVRFTDNYSSAGPKRFRFIDKISMFSGEHSLLDRLPVKWRNRCITFLYKLGLIRSIGYVQFTEFIDGDPKKIGQVVKVYNIIPNVGVTQVRDILTGSSSNLPQNMEFGVGTNTPVVGDTDLQTALDTLGGGGDKTRIVATVTAPGTFEIRLDAFLSGTYGPTRPYTINEFGAFFDPEESGILLARAIVSPGFAMTGSNTAQATYGILLR